MGIRLCRNTPISSPDSCLRFFGSALTWAMQVVGRSLLAATLLFAPCIALNSPANLVSVDPVSSDPSASAVPLHVNRASPYDLELGGDLAGLPPGTTRYVTRDQLLSLFPSGHIP